MEPCELLQLLSCAFSTWLRGMFSGWGGSVSERVLTVHFIITLPARESRENFQIGKRDFAQSMHTVHHTSYFIVVLLHKHPNETTLTEWALVWLCVRAVAALQCEVCTQRTAACDCQSYDSFRNSWSSSVVTLPFPSEFNFISPCLSCRSISLSHPPSELLTFILLFLALKVSHQIPYYLCFTLFTLHVTCFSCWSKVKVGGKRSKW